MPCAHDLIAALDGRNGMQTQEEKHRAAYISKQTFQLAEIARTDGFELLAQLLEMATLEAERKRRLAGKGRHNGG